MGLCIWHGQCEQPGSQLNHMAFKFTKVFPQVQLVSMTNVKIKRQRGKEISLIQHNCLRTSLSATSYLFIQRQQVRNVF